MKYKNQQRPEKDQIRSLGKITAEIERNITIGIERQKGSCCFCPSVFKRKPMLNINKHVFFFSTWKFLFLCKWSIFMKKKCWFLRKFKILLWFLNKLKTYISLNLRENPIYFSTYETTKFFDKDRICFTIFELFSLNDRQKISFKSGAGKILTENRNRSICVKRRTIWIFHQFYYLFIYLCLNFHWQISALLEFIDTT